MSTIEVSLWRGRADGRYRDLHGAAAREPDRARRRHLGAAQRRSHAVLSLRLPRRHVRLVRHDGQRPPALDLPHARLAASWRTAGSRSGRSPTCRSSRTSPATWPRSSRSGRRPRACFAPSKTRADPIERDLARQRPAPRGRRRDRMHQLRRCATRPATPCAGTRTISAPPRSTAPGRSSTTCATPATAARLAAVAADGGCHACHSHQSCQQHCPKALNPTASIAGLKRRDRCRPSSRGEI